MNPKACCCCCCCCCSHVESQVGIDNLKAEIVNADYNAKTVDTTGSIGDNIRILIKTADGTIKEITPYEPNTGTNQIGYTSTVENGDIICTQVSNGITFDFGTFDQSCKTIPTPIIGFVLP